MKSILILLAALIVAGCDVNRPVAITSTNNPDYQVAKLFTNGKCTVYRFRDGGYNRYYTECTNESASTTSTFGCGKGCTHTDQIDTNEEQQ